MGATTSEHVLYKLIPSSLAGLCRIRSDGPNVGIADGPICTRDRNCAYLDAEDPVEKFLKANQSPLGGLCGSNRNAQK